jgi:hypothetical protein
MANPANYIALVAQCLSDDNALNALVDGNIIAGFRRALADDYLTGTNKACLGVRNLNLNGQDLPGAAYHGISDYDMLIEFHIVNISTNDTYISSIVNEIMRIMKRPLSKTIGGVTYSVSTTGRITFTPVNDPAFQDRVEVTGTCRLRYLDS